MNFKVKVYKTSNYNIDKLIEIITNALSKIDLNDKKMRL